MGEVWTWALEKLDLGPVFMKTAVSNSRENGRRGFQFSNKEVGLSYLLKTSRIVLSIRKDIGFLLVFSITTIFLNEADIDVVASFFFHPFRFIESDHLFIFNVPIGFLV